MIEVPELPKQKFLLSQTAGIPAIKLCRIADWGKRFSVRQLSAYLFLTPFTR